MTRRTIILLGLLLLLASVSAIAADRTVLDLDGNPADPFSDEASWYVFVFTSIDCPIANRYAPELKRLGEEFSGDKILTRLVYADPRQSPAEIRTHLTDYGYSFTALRDHQHVLVDLSGVTITPEVAVFDARSKLIYRGRIDDLYVDFGKRRATPTQRDLEQTLQALVDGRELAPRTTQAVGCYIPTLD
jgi:hypothetical protein